MLQNEIITRQDAIRCGLREYFTGKPCINGHVAKRYLNSSACYLCIHPPVPAPGQELRAARAEARKRMEVRRFKVLDSGLQMFEAQMLGLALSYESTLELRDLSTRAKIIRLSKIAAIRAYRIFPEMEAYLRSLEPREWGEPKPSNPLAGKPAEYWPDHDPA